MPGPVECVVVVPLRLEGLFAVIEDELRSQYNIGYSTDKAYDGSFRKIRLTTKSKDLSVQARGDITRDSNKKISR